MKLDFSKLLTILKMIEIKKMYFMCKRLCVNWKIPIHSFKYWNKTQPYRFLKRNSTFLVTLYYTSAWTQWCTLIQGVSETIECKSDLLGKFVHSTEILRWVDPNGKVAVDFFIHLMLQTLIRVKCLQFWDQVSSKSSSKFLNY